MFKKFRDKLQKQPHWIGLISVGVLLALVWWNFSPAIRATIGSPPPSTWFYEADSGTLFVAPDLPTDRVRSPAGKPAFRAAVFSCGDCAKPESRFAGWLERDELISGRVPAGESQQLRLWRRALDEGDQGEGAAIRLWIRPPESAKWAPKIDETVAMLRQRIEEQCGRAGGKAVGCPVPR